MRLKVLIAVDHPLMPEGMRRTLEACGYVVTGVDADDLPSPMGRVGRDEARRVDTAAACGYCGHPGHPGGECGCDVPDGSGGFPCGCCPDLGPFRSRRTTVTGQKTRAPVISRQGTKALPNCSDRMEAS
jgi:hypothetical protein